MNTKRSAIQDAYSGLSQYRAEGTWWDRDIPEFILYSLCIQEESGETKIEFLARDNELVDIASDGHEAFLSRVSRYAYWHTYWTTWMDQESNAPWLESWIQDVAIQLTPDLPQLHAKLLAFFVLTISSDIFISEQDDSPVISIGPLPLSYSLDAVGMPTVGIPLDDPALTPLVNEIEAGIACLWKRDEDFLPLLWHKLGHQVWRDYAVTTTCEIESDYGQDALAAMSPDELLAAIVDYSADVDRYSDLIISLVSGYMHRWIGETMLESVDKRVSQDPTFDDDSRVDAAERVWDREGHGIATPLWTYLKPILGQLAAQHNRTLPEELKLHKLSAMFVALGEENRDDAIASDRPSIGRRTRLHKHLRTSLIDSSRKQRRQYSLDSARSETAVWPHVQAEIRLTVEQTIKEAQLSERETELMLALMQGESLAAIARRLGIAASTARNTFARARKKMRAKKILQEM